MIFFGKSLKARPLIILSQKEVGMYIKPCLKTMNILRDGVLDTGMCML